ncbi:carboxylesterase family protein [Nocardia terpenica]|uniref:carboxylesterase/lipase family protein n=1 Tax=Nocardia terpenica TaxID=455432 RepID=UPI00189445CA|nr:carboxylesterase family protein [Nocardia terpenica]MBF6061464.1 carboxylesterase family protein [Nocardia terpenica]MBF6105307.1 carboxylesterase family protein [Nocardia terpenica]MBF6113223.1 carboxylesterase family protein [Nocardia terpenica]MBF6119353.1 carboxylesterase family protein [Nocardia terpenica]MBF6153001.1 carboxylesterase family protein [Nocardia terpenica]
MRRLRVAGLCALAALLAGCGTPGPAPHSAPVVTTESGAVRGVETDGLVRFRDIPYAAPPVGDLRWRSPQPVTPWTGTRDATRSGPVCRQPAAPEMPRQLPQSEDCLTLDITTPPAGGTEHPVLVWLPGGGFITGAGSIYDPARLVRAADAVVVTVNYRLGVFGFYANRDLGDSNFGLQDQLAALRWVHANIARFGGDPGRVTLAGASAGAMSTCTLMTAPQARDLFRQAVVASGSCETNHPAGALGPGVAAISTWQPLDTIQRAGRALAAELSCPDTACLRGKPADELLPHTAEFPLVAVGTPLVPTAPAEAFAAGTQANIPLLQGDTNDEHVEFTLAAYPQPLTADQYTELLRTAFGQDASSVEQRYPAAGFPSPTAAAGRVFSDRDWICPAWREAREHNEKASTYTYLFADPSAPTPAGNALPTLVRPAAAHGSDMPYLFDFPDGPPLTPAQRPLAAELVRYWAAFLRTGNPDTEGLPTWPRLDTLEFAPDTTRTIDLTTSHHCDFWDTIEDG